MQSLLGVDLFGTHGDDMKQISDRKEHQTQNRIRGEYENREGPWRGDTGPRVHDSTHFFSTKTSPRHDGSSMRAGDRIVAVNGTTGPAEKLLSLLRRDSKKRRLTLVRPQTEESVGWRDSTRARRKLFV